MQNNQKKGLGNPPYVGFISVIIPTYNRSKELITTCASVIKQRFPYPMQIEIVVVDDASTDDTREVSIEKIRQSIDEYNTTSTNPNKLSLLYHYNKEGPQGPSHSRNIGTQLCLGRHIVYLDSDDIFYDDHALYELFNSIRANEQMGVRNSVAYGDTLMKSKHGNTWEAAHIFTLPKFSLRELIDSWGIIPTGSFMFPKEMLKGKPPFKTEMSVGEDFEWQVRMAALHPFTHVEKTILIYYRSTTGQLVTKTTNAIERERSHNLLNKTISVANMSTKTSKLEPPAWGIVPLFPEEFAKTGEDVPLLNKGLGLLHDNTLFKHVDVLVDGELLKHPEPPKDGVSILWILPGMKLNSKHLYDIIKDYAIILTFNCAFTERLKNHLAGEPLLSKKYVSTLEFPMVYPKGELVSNHKNINLSCAYVMGSDDEVITSLEDHSIRCCVDYPENLFVSHLQKMPGVLALVGSKFFYSRKFFHYVRYGLPIICTGKLGAGLRANNSVVYLRNSDAVGETAENIISKIPRAVSAAQAENAFHQCKGNPSFSTRRFADKFDSIVRRAVIELSDWENFSAKKIED